MDSVLLVLTLLSWFIFMPILIFAGLLYGLFVTCMIFWAMYLIFFGPAMVFKFIKKAIK